jgi:hypothetical protein
MHSGVRSLDVFEKRLLILQEISRAMAIFN